MAYIEKRKTWIKAIHKCIMEKWNPICMGCEPIKTWEGNGCHLCMKQATQSKYNDGECHLCSLHKANNGCNDENSTYDIWCNLSYSKDQSQSEEMLEALVMLLPPEERKIYGG